MIRAAEIATRQLRSAWRRLNETEDDIKQIAILNILRNARSVPACPDPGGIYWNLARQGIIKRLVYLSRAKRNAQEISLNAPITIDTETTLVDIMPDDNAVDPTAFDQQNTVREVCVELLNRLPDEKRNLLWLYYGFADCDFSLVDLSRSQAGRERLRQQILSSLRFLRPIACNEYSDLKEYLT